MRRWNNIKMFGLLLAVGCTMLTGCKKKIGMTTVQVPDSIRHYYPVIAGQDLDLIYDVTNTGDEPLIIRDIQPSCGCIVTMPESRMVLPEKTIRLKFKYQSAKNIGFVQHVIRIHGNIKPHGIAKLVFDVNVVPHADYTRDYEELYKEAVERNEMLKGLVDGEENEHGYYVDINKDSRSHEQYPWREEKEK
ncbi:DUF1573 domain-containing protein [Bacteroidales bacterium SW292]|nr:DUF1573 domain-containing protein [Bacteroidales bacterium SW292]